jgi:hypothetical protein
MILSTQSSWRTLARHLEFLQNKGNARTQSGAGKRTKGDKNEDRRKNRGQTDDSTQSAHDNLLRDILAGVNAIRRSTDSTWWEWKRGYAVFFWRWPTGEQRTLTDDGMPIWIKMHLLKYQHWSRSPDPLLRPYILEKLKKILDQGYVVAPGERDFIWSLMDCLAVQKYFNNHLVYNGTSCGLNDFLWAPEFWLPMPSTAAGLLGYGYFMANIDFLG